MNATNIAQPFGYLTWWTIHQGVYGVKDLTDQAVQNNLPPAIGALIAGMDERSAWLKATQLGAAGQDAPQTGDGLRAKFYTKELGEEMRAITYEVVDRQQKKVFARQVATLGRDNRDIVADVEEWCIDDQTLVLEIMNLIHTMQDEFDKKVGNIDDGKVRNLILNWLEQKHRVCVRGSGGVYFIPGVTQENQTEILAVRQWILDAGLGIFSTVTLHNDSATSISDLQQSAVEEVLRELAEISESLDKYESNENMNDGSKMYSSGTQLKKLNSLEEKITALNDALGDIQDRVNAEFTLINKMARKMWTESKQNVVAVRREKSGATSEDKKKSGTTLDRSKKKVVA